MVDKSQETRYATVSIE